MVPPAPAPQVTQGAEERACALALGLLEGARALGEAAGGAGGLTLCVGVHAAVSVVGSAEEADGALLVQGEAPTLASNRDCDLVITRVLG